MNERQSPQGRRARVGAATRWVFHWPVALGKDEPANDLAKLPIALPLRFVEVLVHGGFLREVGLGFLVLEQVRRFVAGQARFEKQNEGELMRVEVMDPGQQ